MASFNSKSFIKHVYSHPKNDSSSLGEKNISINTLKPLNYREFLQKLLFQIKSLKIDEESTHNQKEIAAIIISLANHIETIKKQEQQTALTQIINKLPK